MRKLKMLLLVMPLAIASFGQKLSKDEIINSSTLFFPEAIKNLNNFLKIPNDGNYPEQVEANLLWCQITFEKMGFKVKKLPTTGVPLLFAEKKFKKKAKTVLFYLQIDGQPADPSSWQQENPNIPVVKELDSSGRWKTIELDRADKNFNEDWRIFARSASDSKGPAMSFISALEILEKQEVSPEFNVKVIMDFQEELGSPTLPEAVTKYKSLLAADIMLVMDGTRHFSNLPTICYGARGIATASIVIYGPKVPLHSGQYGNYAPNPVFSAAKLIASLKDDDGRVLISGFYDGVRISDNDKKFLTAIPEDHNKLNVRLGISGGEKVGGSYQEALQYPSLNIRGLKSAWVGKEVRTIIPSEVVIEIDMRLVPETPADRQINLLKSHIISQGFHYVNSTPTDEERAKYDHLFSLNSRKGSAAFRTEMDSEAGIFCTKAMKYLFGDDFVNMRTTGGSQPIGTFINTLGIPAVSVRIPNPDNNIHSPNENLRLGNYLEGIQTCLSILTQEN